MNTLNKITAATTQQIITAVDSYAKAWTGNGDSMTALITYDYIKRHEGIKPVEPLTTRFYKYVTVYISAWEMLHSGAESAKSTKPRKKRVKHIRTHALQNGDITDTYTEYIIKACGRITYTALRKMLAFEGAKKSDFDMLYQAYKQWDNERLYRGG